MRFCVFCGEKLPEQAVFCPSCGSKQPQEAKEEEPIVEESEEDENSSIALSLLSKANFVSTKNSKPVIPQYEPKKAKKVDANGDIIEPTKPATTEILKEPEKEEVKINIPSIKKMEENNSQMPELQIKVEYDDEMDEEDAREMAQMMEMMNRGSDSYTPPILNDIAEEIRENKIAENYEEITAESQIEEQNAATLEQEGLEESVFESALADSSSEEKLESPVVGTAIVKETPAPVSTSSTRARRNRSERLSRPSRPSYKKRNYSAEDESEDSDDTNEKRVMKTTSTLGEEDNTGLTADEIADIEKYKKYKESGQEKEDKEDSHARREGRTVKGEGRKATGHKKEIRRNIDKEISERDIREIQHEETENKNDIDKDYDGYYENVKPIDFDKMHDNSAVVKTVLTAGAVIILACIVFYFVFSFFLQ